MTNNTRKNTKLRRGKHSPISRKTAGASDSRVKAPAAKPKRGNNNPQANFKRYLDLAREAASAGEKVQSEYYYQHADHYHRLIIQS